MRIGIYTHKLEWPPLEIWSVNAYSVAKTLNELGEQPMVIYSIREGIDPINNLSKMGIESIYFKHSLFEKFDAIYASSPPRPFLYHAFMLSALLKKPLFFHLFSITLGPLGNPLLRLMFQKFISKRVILFSVSESHMEFLNKKGISSRILPPCISDFSNDDAVVPCERTPSILFIGSSGDKYRGIIELLKAFSLLLEAGFRVKMTYINKYNQYDDEVLQLAIKLNVRRLIDFTGCVENIKNYYQRSSVYALPLRGPHPAVYPFTILEAMKYRCPIVASKVPFLTDLLPEDCLVKPFDVENLAKKLQRAIYDPNYPRPTLPPQFNNHTVCKKLMEHIYTSE